MKNFNVIMTMDDGMQYEFVAKADSINDLVERYREMDFVNSFEIVDKDGVAEFFQNFPNEYTEEPEKVETWVYTMETIKKKYEPVEFYATKSQVEEIKDSWKNSDSVLSFEIYKKSDIETFSKKNERNKDMVFNFEFLIKNAGRINGAVYALDMAEAMEYTLDFVHQKWRDWGISMPMDFERVTFDVDTAGIYDTYVEDLDRDMVILSFEIEGEEEENVPF